MIVLNCSKEEFDKKLNSLSKEKNNEVTSNKLFEEMLQIVKKYTHQEVFTLLDSIENKKISKPLLWLEVIIFLRNSNEIVFSSNIEWQANSLNIPAIKSRRINNNYRKWVFISDETSIEDKKISLLSIIETCCAISLYVWLAFHFKYQW